MNDCVFCRIIAGTAPATMAREWPEAVAFVPLDPVNDGHLLVVPRTHVADATTDLDVTAVTMRRASELVGEADSANIVTSIGAPATQSVFHLHLHVISRAAGDQLMVPWGTTGNPRDPHECPKLTAARRTADDAIDMLLSLAAMGLHDSRMDELRERALTLRAALGGDQRG